MNFKRVLVLFAICFALYPAAQASDPPPPVIESINASGNTHGLRFVPYPGAQAYTFYSASNVAGPFAVNTNLILSPYISGYVTNIVSNQPVVLTNLAYEWRNTNASSPGGFYRLGVTPLSSNALLTANVLNRLAYGPTPDELERVAAIGPQAYINEQLNMDGIVAPLDAYTIEVTNAVPSDPTTNWTLVSITGTMASATFYLFTTQPADAYIDDIELHPHLYMQHIVTNMVDGTNVYVTNRVFSHVGDNVLVNGGFEVALSPWTAVGGASGSAVDGSKAHSGSSSLHVVSSTRASTPGSSYVRQVFPNTYPTTNTWGDTVTNTYLNSDPVTLTYWYLPSEHSQKLRLQLGGGLNSTPGGVPPTPAWVYATATGTAGTASRLYVYLSGAGDCYVDDIKLVEGNVPEAGPNLLQNGDFESALSGLWTVTADFAGSTLDTTVAHNGAGSLHLVASAAGSGNNDSVYQTITPSLVNGQTYTVSFWYLPARPNRYVTVKLHGDALLSIPDRDMGGLYYRLTTGQHNGIEDLRAWFAFHAVNSPRQLLEILSQFWENHFVTQYIKSRNYLSGRGYSGAAAGPLAADWEFRETTKWRNAMLNPNCTFYDLLRISAESPAMIVYLDTVSSRGDGNRVANENYARELLELFTFGVDNGYDQDDIILMSRAWTGWSVELVDAAEEDNPFAPASLTFYPNTNSTSKPNTIGVWAFNFKAGNHGTNRGTIFTGKTVPARFGPPWAGASYELNIPPRATGTTNGIQDGYDVIAHLANQPFTQEYLSIKLCRLFVHDDFPNPSTSTNLPPGQYDFYDYTNPNRTAEAELVHQCMLAWENSSPKGNLRAVLNTIFSSDLLREHTGVAQKIKTPLEFVASSVRALRSMNPDGTATASTDGFSFTTPLGRMGEMALFDRGDPDGYPEVGPSWISAGTLVERIRYVQAFLNSGTGDDAGGNVCNPVALLKKKLSAGSWNDAGAVADFFMGTLYPGEGAGNLLLYREAAVNFLNVAEDGTTPSLFSALSDASNTYDTRVRGMVAMLMTLQRFQEQ